MTSWEESKHHTDDQRNHSEADDTTLYCHAIAKACYDTMPNEPCQKNPLFRQGGIAA